MWKDTHTQIASSYHRHMVYRVKNQSARNSGGSIECLISLKESGKASKKKKSENGGLRSWIER